MKTLKRLAILAIMLLSLVVLLTVAASAETVASGTCGKNMTWTLDDAGTLTISGTGTMTGHGWSEYGDTIQTVVMKTGVTNIVQFAFSDCANLHSVEIPKGVTSIEGYAFQNCTSLTSVNIPITVTTLGDYVFAGSGLTSIIVPSSVTSISEYTFRNCPSLVSIRVADDNPNYSSDIHGVLFNKNQTVLIQCPGGFSGSYTIPSGASVGHWAFLNCKELTAVTIPNGFTTVNNEMFFGCTGLKKVTLPDSVTAIGYGAFEYCESLTDIEIPNGVTSIGERAFAYCYALTDINIPVGVTKIYGSTFYYCKALKSITIPENVTSIGKSAFFSCDSLTEIVIPDGATSIGEAAFRSCHNLTRVAIPSSVTSIGGSAFYGCSSLTGVALPDDITNIGSYSFYGCTRLTSINIPDCVTTIDNYAFYNCSSLTSITVPDSVTSIGSYSFYGCTSLTSITIPDSVANIGNTAFYYCNNLLTVFYRGTLAQKNGIVIGANNSKLENAVWHYEVEDVIYAGKDCYYCNHCGRYFLKDAAALAYTVIFADEDGTVLSKRTYSWGDVVTEPVDPIKKPDNTYFYTFAGWDKEVVNCTEDATYTATYTSDYIDYTVIFADEDGTELSKSTYHWGDKVIVPKAPEKATDNAYAYTYSFAGWDKEVTDCAGNVTYTATYTTIYINYTVIFVNEDGTELSKKTYHWGDKVTVPQAPEKPADNTYTYAFAGWDKEVVNCTGDATYTATYTSDYINYTVIFADEDGTELSKTTYHWGDKVTVPEAPEKPTDNPYAYTYAFAGWDKAVTDCAGNVTYTATYTPIYIDYTVIFANEDGTELSKNTYHWGDTVVAPEAPEKPTDNTYTYIFAGWDKDVVTCAGDATYTATYTPAYIDYTVMFKNWDGTEISSTTYHWGDTVEVPVCPVRPNDKNCAYTFAGWDQEITVCDGDKVYTAIYNSWKFADVSTSGWQIAPIAYVFDRGLMAGKGTDANGNIKFDPNSPITREEFVQVLYNAESKPSVNFVYNFLDVVKNAWYENAVLWAKKNDIANGTPDGNFGVGKNITRQDLAMMLYKYAKLKGCSLAAEEGKIDQFADGDKVADYAKTAMNWAVTNGILSGKGEVGKPLSTFCLDPAGTATRAECAAMLKNFMTAFEL